MRTGIISDIHSNLQAAEAVLKFMKNLSIDRYICLGDLVGYGGNPVEVVEMVRPPVEFTVMGNHDAAVAGRMDYTYYYDAARQINYAFHYYRKAGVRGGSGAEEILVLKQRQFFPREMDQWLVNSGFRVIGKYGDFSGGPFSGEAEVMVYVCEAG